MTNIQQNPTRESRADDVLQRQNKFLVALQDSTFDLVSETNPEKLLINIVTRACTLLDSSSGYLDLLQPGADHLTPTVALGLLADESRKFKVRRGEGLTGKVWDTGSPIVIDDYDKWVGRISNHEIGLIGAIVAVPLIAKGGIVGVMGVAREKGSESSFDAESVEHLNQFARIAAIAIENARLHETILQELDQRKAEISERRRAEIALQESEKKFRSITEQMTDMVFVTDTEGMIAYVSPIVRKIFGYLPSEMEGHLFIEFLAESEIQKAFGAFKESIAAGTSRTNLELKMKRKDTSTFIGELNATIYQEDGVAGTIGLIRDITDRKKTEVAMRENEEQFRTVADWTYDWEYWIDGKFNMIWCSPSCERITGYSVEEFSKNPYRVEELVHPEDRSIFEDHKKELSETSQPNEALETEFRIIKADGSVRWIGHLCRAVFSHDGTYRGRRVSNRDITERKQAELILMESDRRISDAYEFNRKILGTPSVGILTYNESGQCTFANDAAAEMAGTDVAGLLKQNYNRLDSWKRDGMYESAQEALDTGTIQVLETKSVTTFGKPGWFQFKFSTFQSEGEKHLLVFMQDITERKEADETRIEREKRYRALFDLSPAGIILLDSTACIVEINDIACKTYGYQREELIGKDIRILVPAEHHGMVEQHIARILSGESMQHEVVNVGKDGRMHSVELRETCIPLPSGGTGILAVSTNITQRKKIEETLRESEERYRLISSTAFDYAFSTLLEEDGNLHLKWVAGAFGEITGYSFDEYVACGGWRASLHPDDLDQDKRDMEALRSNREIVTEIRTITKNGSILWVRVYAHPVWDTDKQRLSGIYGAVQDITERKRAEEALRESERLLTEAQEIGAIGSWEHNLIENKMVYSRETYRLMGMQSDNFEHTIEGFLGLVHPEDRPIVVAFSKSVIYSNGPEEVDFRFIRPDCVIRNMRCRAQTFFDLFNKPYRVAGTLQDITERKQAEKALKESEEQFRLISENVADLIAVLDLEGRRVYNSPSYSSILGESDLLKGTDSFQEIHPDDREQMRQIFIETIHTGKSRRMEYRLVGNDGAIHFIESLGSVIRDSEGKVTNVVRVGRDVTEKKRLEQKSFRTQRLESIGTLASGVAHDLNNVLSPIVLAIEVLKDYIIDTSGLAVLDMLAISAHRGSDIVKQILGFARGMDGERTTIQPRHLVAETIKITSETFPKNITVKAIIPKDTWTITGDGTQFQQVLLNLCVNARDAMPEGGTLTLSVENTVIDGSHSLVYPDAKPGNYVLLTVKDTGSGIPPELRDRIFEPFFTTKERGKGTGLGLSTVHGIIKSHEGFIDLESEMGRGTTFKIYFPAGQTAVVEKQIEDSSNILRGNRECILVIDDEESILEITRQTLESFNYSVLTAKNGFEGVELYRLHSTGIDLVVTDMMMPTLDGYQAVQFLRSWNKNVKIIGCSGLVSDDRGHAMIIATLDGFLRKPYEAGQLLEAIAKVLRGKNNKTG